MSIIEYHICCLWRNINHVRPLLSVVNLASMQRGKLQTRITQNLSMHVKIHDREDHLGYYTASVVYLNATWPGAIDPDPLRTDDTEAPLLFVGTTHKLWMNVCGDHFSYLFFLYSCILYPLRFIQENFHAISEVSTNINGRSTQKYYLSQYS
jgi:hypothetical protein